MVSANLGSPPRPDNGHMVEEQSKVDTHGGERCICATNTYCVHLSANGCEHAITRPSCVFRGMAVILCNDNLRCLSLGISFSLLSAVYYFLLRTVLCLRFFFTPAHNDWPFMKYASNYFPLRAVSLPACVLPPLAESVFAHAFSSHPFSSRVAVSPGSDILPSLSHHLA
jgi:hypothetical protein